MKRYETYKDSGIQWVGEIPSHWDVVKTSYLFDDIGSGTTPNTNDDSLYDTDNGINWLQTGDLNDGHITKTSKKISQKAIEGNGTLRLYPINSLVIALYGATIGKVGVLDIESTTNQACCVLPPSDKISTDFAYYIFLASKEALLNLAALELNSCLRKLNQYDKITKREFISKLKNNQQYIKKMKNCSSLKYKVMAYMLLVSIPLYVQLLKYSNN